MSAQIFILQELVMDHLEESEAEGYIFSPAGVQNLKLALPRVLQGHRPKEELEALLGLAMTLEEDFNAPTAANTIYAIVKGEPQAQEQIAAAREVNDPILVGEAFERFLDSASSLVAPYFDNLIPEGFFPIFELPEFRMACNAIGTNNGRYVAGVVSPR